MFTVLAARQAAESAERPAHERRRHGRVCVRGVECTLGDVLNLSPRGLCVQGRGKAPVTPGGLQLIDLPTPVGVVRIAARVAWTKEEGRWPRRSFRMGVEFLELGAVTEAAVREAFRDGLNNAVLGSVD